MKSLVALTLVALTPLVLVHPVAHAQKASHTAPGSLAATSTPPKISVVGSVDGKTVTFPKESAAESVCFEADCLTFVDLKALVANRKAAGESIAAFAQTQQVLGSLRSTLATKIREVDQLGELQAQLLNGELVDAREASIKMKASIEKQNPGKSIDDTGKIIDLPKAEKKAGGGSSR